MADIHATFFVAAIGHMDTIRGAILEFLAWTMADIHAMFFVVAIGHMKTFRGALLECVNWTVSGIHATFVAAMGHTDMHETRQRSLELERDLLGLRNDTSQVRQENEVLRNDIGQLRQENEVHRNDIGQLRQIYNDLRNDIGRVRQENDDLHNEVASLTVTFFLLAVILHYNAVNGARPSGAGNEVPRRITDGLQILRSTDDQTQHPTATPDSSADNSGASGITDSSVVDDSKCQNTSNLHGSVSSGKEAGPATVISNSSAADSSLPQQTTADHEASNSVPVHTESTRAGTKPSTDESTDQSEPKVTPDEENEDNFEQVPGLPIKNPNEDNRPQPKNSKVETDRKCSHVDGIKLANDKSDALPGLSPLSKQVESAKAPKPANSESEETSKTADMESAELPKAAEINPAKPSKAADLESAGPSKPLEPSESSKDGQKKNVPCDSASFPQPTAKNQATHNTKIPGPESPSAEKQDSPRQNDKSAAITTPSSATTGAPQPVVRQSGQGSVPQAALGSASQIFTSATSSTTSPIRKADLEMRDGVRIRPKLAPQAFQLAPPAVSSAKSIEIEMEDAVPITFRASFQAALSTILAVLSSSNRGDIEMPDVPAEDIEMADAWIQLIKPFCKGDTFMWDIWLHEYDRWKESRTVVSLRQFPPTSCQLTSAAMFSKEFRSGPRPDLVWPKSPV